MVRKRLDHYRNCCRGNSREIKWILKGLWAVKIGSETGDDMLRKRKRFSDDDEDPMTGISNLSDAMLVLALGFLIFAIMALQVNPDMMAKTHESQAKQATSQVSTGEDFTSNASAGSSLEQSGYAEVGKVYRDPDTGKLVMVQE